MQLFTTVERSAITWLILCKHTNNSTHFQIQTASNNPLTTCWCVKRHRSGPERRSVWRKPEHVYQASHKACHRALTKNSCWPDSRSLWNKSIERVLFCSFESTIQSYMLRWERQWKPNPKKVCCNWVLSSLIK